ncbi:MAG TPA: hypothetical protein VIU64_22325, partial [Polyangia bacterium]
MVTAVELFIPLDEIDEVVPTGPRDKAVSASPDAPDASDASDAGSGLVEDRATPAPENSRLLREAEKTLGRASGSLGAVRVVR